MCGIATHPALGKHKLENLLSDMSRKAGLATIYTSHCFRATRVTILKASGLENSRVKSVTGHIKERHDRGNYHSRPTLEQQVQSSAIVSEFVAGSSKNDGALTAIQQNQAVSVSSASVASASSQVARASYVSHVEHSVSPSSQSFTAGQFHNCIFNVNYCSH